MILNLFFKYQNIKFVKQKSNKMSKIKELLNKEIDRIDHIDDDFFYQKWLIKKGDIKTTLNQIKSYYEEKNI